MHWSLLYWGAKKILGLEHAIRGDMGLDTLRSRRNKLKWWYKLVSMPENVYPNCFLVRSGLVEVDRGKPGCMQEVEEGDSLAASFMN